MSPLTTINALFIHVADSDVGQIVSLFRQSGQIVREHNIHSLDLLPKLLSEQSWDTVFLGGDADELSPQRCKQLLEQYRLSDVPLFVLSDQTPDSISETDIAGGFHRSELPRLVKAAQRELKTLQLQRELSTLQEQLAASSQRNQLLLSEHSDAICYVVDGMIIHANSRFWSLLELEELDGFPLVDLIATQDQELSKSLLRKAEQGDQNNPVDLRFIDQQGQVISLLCSSNKAKYDDEDCVQLTLQQAADLSGSSLIDPSTGLANHQHFVTQLQGFLENERSSNCSLLMIGLDDYGTTREDVGPLEMEQLLGKLANKLQHSLPGQLWGRLADDIICLLSKSLSNEALNQAQQTGKAIESELLETTHKSQHCTISTAVFPITHLTPPSAEQALQASFKLLCQLRQEGGNQARVYSKERQQLNREESASHIVEEALNDKRLQLLFQPMVNLGAAEGDHYEVQLDIKDHQEGEVTAGEILRSIERDPLNPKLDRWIVIEATKQLAQKRSNGEEVVLVINLSSNVFHDLEFCPWLSVAMRAAGLPPSSIILQFSEESIGNSLKAALDFAKKLEQLGLSLAVRNFCRNKDGNKFLAHLRPGLVKPGVRRDENLDNEAVRQLVQQARNLSARITIPNVSSAASLASLWQLGPDFIQGSYIHEPLADMSYQFSSF